MQCRQKLAEAAAAKATEQAQDAAMLAAALRREREDIAAEQARKAANSRNQHLYRSSSNHTHHMLHDAAHGWYLMAILYIYCNKAPSLSLPFMGSIFMPKWVYLIMVESSYHQAQACMILLPFL